jgi:hypothetical protein
MPRKKTEPPIVAVIDFETDPFLYGRKPEPFAAGFYDGRTYQKFWGDDCVIFLIEYIRSLKTKHIIYAHNGGKFDFFYLLEENALQNPALIISGRIVKCVICDIHELRDSYAILPLPLSKLGNQTNKKLEIDYSKMEKSEREKNKDEILDYLKADCLTLHNVVSEFYERYEGAVTVGAMAIKELGKHHFVSRQDRSHDELFRPYYFGGRVSCFENGELIASSGKVWKFYDVNSMYPKAMRDFDHPSGKQFVFLGEDKQNRLNRTTGDLKGFSGMYFIKFIGTNKRALPTRDIKTGGLSFDQSYGEFFTTSHELKVALELKLVTIEKVLELKVPCHTIRFDTFVDTYMEEKIKYKKSGEQNKETFAKLTLNSAYGKFATDVDKFKEWFILDSWDEEQIVEFAIWEDEHKNIGNIPQLENDLGQFKIFSVKAENEKGFFDVAVAASITSASRSILLRAIAYATRPIYCDTDSLICLEIGNVEIDDSKLGAWKFEGSTKIMYIAGKKMYGAKLIELDKEGKEKFKMATKGARLTYDEIKSLCSGQIISWRNIAPSFSIKVVGANKQQFSITTKFTERNIRKII